MSEYIGKQIEVGLSKESVRNTAEATCSRWLKKVKADIMVKEEKVIDDSTRGRLEGGEGARIVKTWYEGSIEGIVHADAIGFLLYNIYGASTDSGSAGNYSHTLTLAQSIAHSTFTIFSHDSAVVKQKLNGGMVSKLEISATVDDYVRFKADVVAIGTASSALTPSYSAESDFIGKDITIKIADTEAGLAGATAIKVKNATIKIDTGLIRDHVFGSLSPDNLYNSNLDFELVITLNHGDTTFLDLYKAETYKYVLVDIKGSGNPELKFTLHKAQVIDWAKAGDADKLVTEEVTFKAFYNATDGAQTKCVLVNSLATL